MPDHLNSRQALAAEITESLKRELHVKTSLEKIGALAFTAFFRLTRSTAQLTSPEKQLHA